MKNSRIWLAAAASLGTLTFASAAQAQGSFYPVYCQGIAVGSGGNAMYISNGFYLQLDKAPEGPSVQEGSVTSDFANEVVSRSGRKLLAQTCYSRPTPAELESLVASTRTSNAASWNVVNVDWMPAGAQPLTATADELALAASGQLPGGALKTLLEAPAPAAEVRPTPVSASSASAAPYPRPKPATPAPAPSSVDRPREALAASSASAAPFSAAKPGAPAVAAAPPRTALTASSASAVPAPKAAATEPPRAALAASSASAKPAPKAVAPAPAPKPSTPTPAPSAAEQQLLELKNQLAAEKAKREEAERRAAEAERLAAIQKADERLRAANAPQAQPVIPQQIDATATLREFDERQRAYEEEQRAFAAAQARYRAESKASADAMQKWRDDLAACSAGDTSRCGGEPPSQ